MKAMVYVAPLTLQIQDVPDPVPRDGEVLIAVEATGICGSELEGFTSQSPFRKPPLIMGHEFVGRRLDTGQRVSVNPMISCGHCDLCLRGQRNLCRTRAIIGIHRPGGFAELVAVPQANCYPVQEAIPAGALALVEPLANAEHAYRLGLQMDTTPHRVGIIGGGAVGTALAVVARHRGAGDLIIADLSVVRRSALNNLGFSDTPEQLAGEFDLIFDAVGSPSTRRLSVDLLRPGGSAVWVGLHGPDSPVDGLDLIRMEKRVLGTFCYHDQDFRASIALAPLVSNELTRSFPLEEGVDIFTRLAAGEILGTKSLLVP